MAGDFSRVSGGANGIPNIRFRPIAIDKVIEQKWSVSEPIEIEPGNLTSGELYSRFPAVDSLTELKDSSFTHID